MVVGADTDMGGVDVSTHSGHHSVVHCLHEGSLDSRGVVDQWSLDSRVVDQRSLDSRVVDQRSLDSRVVDHGSLDSRGIDLRSVNNGLVDTSGVDQGGVSLSLTLGDVRHNGAGGEGLEAGEDLGEEGGGESGVVDGVDHTRSVVDQGGLDSRVVDKRLVEGHGLSVDLGSVNLLHLVGLLHVLNLLSLREGLVDQRLVEGHGVSVDQRAGNLLSLLSLLSQRVGLVDDGRVDSGSEGQSVGVDQSRVRLRLSISLSLAVGVVHVGVVGVGGGRHPIVVVVVVWEGLVLVPRVEELWVRFRLSHGHGGKSENYKELHAEAWLDCLELTVTLPLTLGAFIRF